MDFINRDYFMDLFISPRESVSKEKVESKYKLILEDMEERKENIYDETLKKKTASEKLVELNKLDEWMKNKKRAYQYCSVDKNILLRNLIVNLNEGNDISYIREIKRNDPEIRTQPIMRKTVRDKEGLETSDLRIIELEKYDLIDGIKKAQLSLKRYKMIIPDLYEDFDYDFYTEDLDIVQLQTNTKYRQAVLRAIELNNMYGDTNYIGRVELDDNGKYIISKNGKIERAVELKQKAVLNDYIERGRTVREKDDQDYEK